MHALSSEFGVRVRGELSDTQRQGILGGELDSGAHLAIESFRAEQLALADAASKRIAQALGDAAEVLTPEQRRKIDEHLTARRAFWRGWHRG